MSHSLNTLSDPIPGNVATQSDTLAKRVQAWAGKHPLVPEEIDCAIAVMLKILDGKCKMNSEEKVVMRHLYHAVKHCPALRLESHLHQRIALAEESCDDAMREEIYELRVLAETMISRPVMKAFKRQIRQQGLFKVWL